MSRIDIELRNQARTAELAAALAPQLQAGDLIILTGGLGAGKTTFTQSLAAHLNVRGRVSSPTFIIAREHPPIGDGPGLVHVDAYRLEDAAELDDLDLDSEQDEVVTVVEWGAGMAESLADDYLEITLTRPDSADPESGQRTATLQGFGESWTDRLARVKEAMQ